MKPRHTTFLKIIAIGFFSAFCSISVAETDVKNNAANTTQATEAATRGLLFEIKSGDKTAFLFGSIHIAKPEFYPMSPKVEAAYKAADTVMVEADTTDTQAMQAMLPKLMYTAPDKLQNHLTPATWTEFQSLFGPAAEQLQNLKPFLVLSAITIQVAAQLGYSPEEGIDLHFIKRSKEDKKTLLELESLTFQANIMGSLSDEEGNSLIASLVDSIKKREIASDLNNLVDAWKAADADAIAKLFIESGNKDAGSKRITKMLLDDRNEGMANKINQTMASGKKLFVVVGAGHLAGEKSVIDLLKKQGLEVKQIR